MKTNDDYFAQRQEEFLGTRRPPLKWRNPYDREENDLYDVMTSIDFKHDDGKTLQAPAEEQDINVIMRRFGVTDGATIPRWPAPESMYGDYSEVPTDPVEAQEYIRRGQLAFLALPAQVRERFKSGAHLYNWLQDDNNTEEAIKLGLLAPPTPPAEPKVSTSTSSDKEPLVQDPKGST